MTKRAWEVFGHDWYLRALDNCTSFHNMTIFALKNTFSKWNFIYQTESYAGLLIFFTSKKPHLWFSIFSFTLRKLKGFLRVVIVKWTKANKVVIIKGQFLPDGKTLWPTKPWEKKEKDPKKNTHKKNNRWHRNTNKIHHRRRQKHLPSPAKTQPKNKKKSNFLNTGEPRRKKKDNKKKSFKSFLFPITLTSWEEQWS